MASLIVSRFLLLKPNTVTKHLSSYRSLFTSTTTLDGLRPRLFEPAVQALAVRRLSSSVNDPMQSTKIISITRLKFPILPPKPPSEGSDLKPYIVFTAPPRRGESTRDGLIEDYVWRLSPLWGSEEEAKKKIYSVSTRFYYTFGALLTKEQASYLEDSLGIRKVLPDVENMEYGDTKLFGGEPFINGEAVPYDPKYHEAWIRTNGEKDYEVDEDFESEDLGLDHWSVVMEEPKSYLSRDEIIDSYIKTLAGVVGSEEEAGRILYSVSTRVSYSFGAILNYSSAQYLKSMPGVKSVKLDVENKKCGGEPFISGEAVPYQSPKFDWFNNRGKEEHESPKRKSKKDEQNRRFSVVPDVGLITL